MHVKDAFGEEGGEARAQGKRYLSPSGDLGIGLVWDILKPHPPPTHSLCGPTVEILFKLN